MQKFKTVIFDSYYYETLIIRVLIGYNNYMYANAQYVYGYFTNSEEQIFYNQVGNPLFRYKKVLLERISETHHRLDNRIITKFNRKRIITKLSGLEKVKSF